MKAARVYIYSGFWVADCPRGCGNTEKMTEDLHALVVSKKTLFHCSYCKYQTYEIEWPHNIEDIDSVLRLRPIPHTRNWYPKDHEAAVKFRIPHGQSVEDLRNENLEHDVPAF